MEFQPSQQPERQAGRERMDPHLHILGSTLSYLGLTGVLLNLRLWSRLLFREIKEDQRQAQMIDDLQWFNS